MDSDSGSEKEQIESLVKALSEKGKDGKSIDDYLQEEKENFKQSAEDFWNSLSNDDRLKAFYEVCKRIHEGDLVRRGSYRYVLYQIFGFGPDAYFAGLECGYIDIHNSIIPPEDMKKTESIISAMMEARDEARREVCELKSHNFEEKISPQSYAAMRKWDCFPDASQSQQ